MKCILDIGHTEGTGKALHYLSWKQINKFILQYRDNDLI